MRLLKLYMYASASGFVQARLISIGLKGLDGSCGYTPPRLLANMAEATKGSGFKFNTTPAGRVSVSLRKVRAVQEVLGAPVGRDPLAFGRKRRREVLRRQPRCCSWAHLDRDRRVRRPQVRERIAGNGADQVVHAVCVRQRCLLQDDGLKVFH